MKICDGVDMLEITSVIRGAPNSIFPTLLWDAQMAVLVDAGFPGQLELIRAAIEQAGVPFERLSDVVLTHHDLDHIGSLVSLRAHLPGLRVWSSVVEQAYIQGEKRPLKLAQMQANLDALPEEQKAFYEMMDAAFQNSFSRVDRTLSENMELPVLGGVRVIDTPGHTFGHFSLYLPEEKILIAGDTLRVENGELGRPAPTINADQAMSLESLKKLAGLDISSVICYHGGLYQGRVSEKIAQLAEG
jgi:glyoxylase-like metal-dependent hydrolase (beta-lactamase superfamily II)